MNILNVNEKQKSQFETYFNFLVDYNQKVNLTAITDKEDVFVKHFYDSCLAKDLIKQLLNFSINLYISLCFT